MQHNHLTSFSSHHTREPNFSNFKTRSICDFESIQTSKSNRSPGEQQRAIIKNDSDSRTLISLQHCSKWLLHERSGILVMLAPEKIEFQSDADVRSIIHERHRTEMTPSDLCFEIKSDWKSKAILPTCASQHDLSVASLCTCRESCNRQLYFVSASGRCRVQNQW